MTKNRTVKVDKLKKKVSKAEKYLIRATDNKKLLSVFTKDPKHNIC